MNKYLKLNKDIKNIIGKYNLPVLPTIFYKKLHYLNKWNLNVQFQCLILSYYSKLVAWETITKVILRFWKLAGVGRASKYQFNFSYDKRQLQHQIFG